MTIIGGVLKGQSSNIIKVVNDFNRSTANSSGAVQAMEQDGKTIAVNRAGRGLDGYV